MISPAKRPVLRPSEPSGIPGSTCEIAVEGAYVIKLNQRLIVQPDLLNPGGAGTIQNSWILGGQGTVNF